MREAKMASKQVTLAVSAVLFTAINLLALSANWSITAHARVAGMDFSALAVDADFRRAIRDIVSQMDQSYWRRNNGFRGAVAEVVERCHLPYRESTSLRSYCASRDPRSQYFSGGRNAPGSQSK